MTKVEEVAVAISGAPFPSPASMRKARAAIKAMRVPTEGMVEAGLRWMLPCQVSDCNDAMIDAALTEEQ